MTRCLFSDGTLNGSGGGGNRRGRSSGEGDSVDTESLLLDLEEEGGGAVITLTNEELIWRFRTTLTVTLRGSAGVETEIVLASDRRLSSSSSSSPSLIDPVAIPIWPHPSNLAEVFPKYTDGEGSTYETKREDEECDDIAVDDVNHYNGATAPG